MTETKTAATARVTATSIATALVTTNATSRMLTTAVAMEWVVALRIQMVKMLLLLTATSSAMVTAMVTEKVPGT